MFCKLQAMIQQRLEESRLMERYRIASDEELLLLANAPEQLTEEAQEVLAAELRSRRIVLREATGSKAEGSALSNQPTVPSGERQLWHERPGDYAETAPADCMWHFGTAFDVYQAGTALALQGIPSDIFFGSRARLDTRNPRLAVLPQDREMAAQLLSRPLSATAREQLRIQKEAEEWSLAPCPHCGAPDPLLTSVDPQNHWRCEECGQTWVDAEAQP